MSSSVGIWILPYAVNVSTLMPGIITSEREFNWSNVDFLLPTIYGISVCLTKICVCDPGW